MKKNVILTVFLVFLALSFTFSTFLPHASAASVIITYFSPTTHQGKVGDTVKITGSANTSGLLYRIWFGDTLIVNNTNAVGNVVDASFKVPSVKRGNYTIYVQDVNANINTTSWFFVNKAYYVEARTLDNKTLVAPKQLQEGDSARVWVNVTGEDPNRICAANVTLRLPSPANTTYWTLVKFNTTANGEGSNQTAIYPSSFQGTPHTNYTGIYTLAFNKTYATSTFKVGLTNSTEYHRLQNVDLKAVGFRPNENVTIKITYGGNSVHRESLIAQAEGIAHQNWAVPANASMGTYTINITSTSGPTNKNPRDVQNITVLGFSINMTAKNLAGESVSNVVIKAFEDGKLVANGNSSSNGLVPLKLEIGSYMCNATFKGKTVGRRTINVTDAGLFDLVCNLTNLRILVANEADVLVPEVKILLKPENQVLTTGVNGTAVAHSLLPVPFNTSEQYVLNASRYDMSFNVTTIQTLLVNSVAVAWFNVSIQCPTLTLQINAFNAEGQPLNNATVKAQEMIGGLYKEAKTDSAGKATFSFIFGKYTLAIYDADGIKLNETTVSLFQNQNLSILCGLYGLTVAVKVTDYFGQPISNVNTVLQREGMAARSSQTGGDGIATFNSVTGGTMQITVYITDQTQPCEEESFFVDKSMTIEIKVGKYVSLAGTLVETSLFAITLIIVLTLVVVLVLEIYRRRSKPVKKENESQNK